MLVSFISLTVPSPITRKIWNNDSFKLVWEKFSTQEIMMYLESLNKSKTCSVVANKTDYDHMIIL